MSLKAPSAWRGFLAEDRGDASNAAPPGTRRVGLVTRIGREIAAHPAETVAIIAMGVAAARLLSRNERPMSLPPVRAGRRSSRLAPIGLMAAICLMMIAGCALLPAPPVQVSPNPATFERAYGDDLVVAGQKLARERCIACHPASGKPGRTGAPALDTLVALRGSTRLNDELVAGLPVGHGPMPQFDFNASAASALLAYLESIAQPSGQER